jgi:hypothetical protein
MTRGVQIGAASFDEGDVAPVCPWCWPIRDNAEASSLGKVMLAVFSGKMPDWMVQIPAPSVVAISAQELAADALAMHIAMDADGMLDHSGVDTTVRYRRCCDPAQDSVLTKGNVGGGCRAGGW